MALSFDPRAVMAPGGIATGLDNLGSSIVDILRMDRQERIGRAREDRQAAAEKARRTEEWGRADKLRIEDRDRADLIRREDIGRADLIRKTDQERADADKSYTRNYATERDRILDTRAAQNRDDQLGGDEENDIDKFAASVPVYREEQVQIGTDAQGEPKYSYIKVPLPVEERRALYRSALAGFNPSTARGKARYQFYMQGGDDAGTLKPGSPASGAGGATPPPPAAPAAPQPVTPVASAEFWRAPTQYSPAGSDFGRDILARSPDTIHHLDRAMNNPESTGQSILGTSPNMAPLGAGVLEGVGVNVDPLVRAAFQARADTNQDKARAASALYRQLPRVKQDLMLALNAGDNQQALDAHTKLRALYQFAQQYGLLAPQGR